MHQRQLILFTRLPVPGKTKTRLIPVLGEQGAADLQREMTEHTLHTVRPLAAEGVAIEVRYEGADRESMAAWLGGDLSFASQGEGDLGVRMERALRESQGAGDGMAVIIGCDCPGLISQDVREAFILLEGNPVVLGPAADGGYYLVGVRSGAPERLFQALFSNIPWGTGEVFSATVNSLADAGISHALVDERNDVDEPADLIHWEKILRARGAGRGAQEGRVKTDSRSGTRTNSTAAISVIIPTLNEEKRIGLLIEDLKAYNLEVIVVDGGSSDGTVAICRNAGVNPITSKPGRAAQMNAGAQAAAGQILLFLHADTRLPEGFPEMIRRAIAGGAAGGAFSLGIDDRAMVFRVIELAANFRSRRLGVVFGDQGIFARADLFGKEGGFPDIPVMEDYELVRSLRKKGRFVILPGRAVTSARKWHTGGVLRLLLIHQAVTWLFLLGASPQRLGKWYRRKSGTVR
jgi:rSAM/selenodomain-associated transferase 2/rSAM/selenodomain-associated transferase 1